MSEVKNFAWPVTAVSKEDYRCMTDFLEEKKKEFRRKKLLVFGAGIRGAIIAMLAANRGHSEVFFSDNNEEKWGGVIDGFPILPPEEAFRRKDEFIFVISAEEGEAIRQQLLAAGLKENEEFFSVASHLYEKYEKEYRRPMNNEVLVLGDCMFEVIAFADQNKDSLGEILKQRMGEDQVKLLTMHGMSMPGFYHAVKGQINLGFVPRTIVVMINFETLTGKQHLLPRSQHSALAAMMSRVSPDPDGELAAYAELTAKRVNEIQADFFTTDRLSSSRSSGNDNGKISDAASKMFLKVNYLYKLDTEMECMQYLRKLLRMAAENHILVIPFVPPVNYERGTQLFGEKFEERYGENLSALKEAVEKEGVCLLDLSHSCRKELFADISTPDETTNYGGRSLIAEYLIKELTGNKQQKENF